jgi:hypothetical protein
MDVVDVKLWKAICFEGSAEVGKFIEFGLLCSPVEIGLPVFSQAEHILQRSTIAPA